MAHLVPKREAFIHFWIAETCDRKWFSKLPRTPAFDIIHGVIGVSSWPRIKNATIALEDQ